ncbi:sensor domain-containing diguanylate cyclase [Cytobacillus solani]|uniref:sensor domain-containing diguanylate cyclase n=1 Tax=Cytobacillus solani TaxID=1637975 RepID=UPI00207935FC|nr:sensor domain-containing diguanylate cyclase [Cytobacillus solani]USK56713.1 sensor domain-containing diguanylate cyclase [Cytobacillus solani]
MFEIKGDLLNSVLMEGIKESVFIVKVINDLDFVYVYLNRAAMEKTGLTKTVIGQSIRDVYAAERADFLIEHYKKVVISLESVTYEDSSTSLLGEMYYSEITLSPLFDDSNKCTHIVALVHDVTEKKWGEFELKSYWDSLLESKQRYRSLYEFNEDAIFSINRNGQIIKGNAAVKDVTGYQANSLTDSNFISLVVVENINTTMESFNRAVEGKNQHINIAITNKSGNRVEVIAKFTPTIVNGEVVGIYWILKDVTEQLMILKMYQESEQRFRIIAENSQDLITMLDEKGKIIYVSPSYKTVLGFNKEEYIGKYFFHNIHLEHKDKLWESILQSIKNEKSWKLQVLNKHKTKGWIWCELCGTPVFDNQSQFIHMVCVTRDIHMQKEYELKLKHIAFHDSLTNLPNRRLFKEKLTHTLNECKKNKMGLAVILMDIDHFKCINDEMGHDIGDEVLVEFSKRVSNCLQNDQIIARLGGDEFTVLLPNRQSKKEVAAIAEQIQKSMDELWNINNHEFKITTSMGIAIIFDEYPTESSILKTADLALYEAKRAGRNTYRIK